MENPTAIVSVKVSKDLVEYQWNDIKTGQHINQPEVSVAEYPVLLQSLKGLSGKVLTLIEASIQDKEQRKAVKDIVKRFFSEEMQNASELCYSREFISELMKGSDSTDDISVDLEDVIRGKV